MLLVTNGALEYICSFGPLCPILGLPFWFKLGPFSLYFLSPFVRCFV
jgi:hypothetical protein